MRRLMPIAAVLFATLAATPALAWERPWGGHGWRPAPAWHHPYRPHAPRGWHRPYRHDDGARRWSRRDDRWRGDRRGPDRRHDRGWGDARRW